MDSQSLTAGQIAGRLTAEEIKPLVEYVEQVTRTKLRAPEPRQAHEPKSPREDHEAHR